MTHGITPRPLESKDGDPSVDVSAGKDGRREVATTDRALNVIAEDMLSELRLIRRGIELLIDQEITDAD